MTTSEQKTTLTDATASVGVFDSGVGGLSVLRHIREQLPHENLMYFADSGFAPYGGKPEEFVVARSLAIAEFLIAQNVKALVVACNTATAASIQAIRERYPELPVVGVEPGLKPAAALTKNGYVGVLATERTLMSKRFNALLEQITEASGVCFVMQACTGLADQVEKGELQSRETAALVQKYVTPLIDLEVDVLVLGCTHYPFVQPLIEAAARTAKHDVAIVDTGDAVARQLVRQLEQHHLRSATEGDGSLRVFTTGSASTAATAFANLLGLRPVVETVST